MKSRLVVVATMLAAIASGAQAQRSGFPHSRHERLFPTCAGCHVGIASGDAAKAFPTQQTCAACHNGRDEREVGWSGPTHRPTNVVFSHTEHAKVSAEARTPALCVNCHATGSDTAWMHVRAAAGGGCVTCHTNATSEHLAETAACRTCHRPLAESRELTAAMIGAFPQPRSHGNLDFASNHAPRSEASIAQCATCHTRESCARCHVNAPQVRAISRLEPDARVAELMRGRAAVYPTPASHRDASWSVTHGAAATKSIATCANCHAQTSCRTCHAGERAPRVIAELPLPVPGGATGVVLTRVAASGASALPASHRAAGWKTGHGQAANTSIASCANCHTQTTCQTCHAGEQAPRVIAQLPPPTPGAGAGPPGTRVVVHEPGFLDRHRTTAASGRLDCTSCHQQRECSSCHEGASSRRYHAADFVSRHSSEGFSQEQRCTSCHRTETFCRSCHLQNGVATTGAKSGAAHTAQPLWLLQHGEAARRGLTGCTTCHQQRDCLRCHSSQGLKVNPHGPDFDASRIAARSKQMCATCHVKDPLKP
ncbi:MAG TPA: cytochrome c3 family protein [Gemmatimonadaceae bacterium]|nr:cytochrome c3 family protein [Gemmatimonadaceae bacterium]